jgi:hypothetical protein
MEGGQLHSSRKMHGRASSSNSDGGHFLGSSLFLRVAIEWDAFFSNCEESASRRAICPTFKIISREHKTAHAIRPSPSEWRLRCSTV